MHVPTHTSGDMATTVPTAAWRPQHAARTRHPLRRSNSMCLPRHAQRRVRWHECAQTGWH